MEKQPDIILTTTQERAERLRGLLYMMAGMSDNDFSMCSQFVGDVFALKGIDATPYDMEWDEVEIEDVFRYVGMRLQ